MSAKPSIPTTANPEPITQEDAPPTEEPLPCSIAPSQEEEALKAAEFLVRELLATKPYDGLQLSEEEMEDVGRESLVELLSSGICRVGEISERIKKSLDGLKRSQNAVVWSVVKMREQRLNNQDVILLTLPNIQPRNGRGLFMQGPNQVGWPEQVGPIGASILHTPQFDMRAEILAIDSRGVVFLIGFARP